MSSHILQSEHPRRAAPREITISVLVPIAFVAIVNLIVAVTDLPGRMYWAHRLVSDKWKLVQADRPAVDWLVLGDSSGNQAVVPEVIRNERGASALNVCTIGDCLVAGDAWMLAEYLERHGPPKKAVLVHVWDSWPNGTIPTQVIARIPVSGAFWDRYQPNYPLGWRERFDIVAAHWLPLYSQSLSLADAVLKFPLRLFGLELIELPRMSDDGFSAFSSPNPDVALRDSDDHIRTLAATPVRVSDINLAAMRQIAALAERHGFEVDVVTGPVSRRLGASEEYRAALTAIDAQVRAALATAPGGERVRLMLLDPPQFEPEEMSNADHVIESAAKAYTRELIRRLP